MQMIDQRLIEYMADELAHTPTGFSRYVKDRILWHDRMIGLTGPRGVGKSTLVKQHILEQSDRDEWLYVSADNVYFAEHRLVDLAIDFMKNGGRHLVIDEIHKYPGWSRELKEIYDGLGSLQVIFTGSSILDINKGQADLSRRALMFAMQGMSLREYMLLRHNIAMPVLSLEQIMGHELQLPADFRPLPYFHKYLREGYLPFAAQPGYAMRLQQIISYSIEADIPAFAGMNVSTARKLKKMAVILAGQVPYKPSVLNLASELHVSKNDVSDYMTYLEMAGIISQVRDETAGMRSLGKVEKVYLDNPNLMYAMSADGVPELGNLRETFFYNQMRVNHDVRASKTSDFSIGKYTFEIGGRGKTGRQLEGINAGQGFIVSDDIEIGTGRRLPLWQFGLTY